MSYNPSQRPDLSDTQPHASIPQSVQPPARPPIPQPPPRRRRVRRGCSRWIFRGFIALILLMFACGASLILYLVFSPPQTDILVMGLDAREGEGAVTRTDSIMLVGVDPYRMRVSLLSIPRDLFIDVPNYGMQRINTINVLAEMDEAGTGPDLLAESIARNFNIQPDRYVRLNFAAFVALVDGIGGIDIYVERVIEDPTFPTADGGTQYVRFESGMQHMNGERALIYARTRHGDDDYARAARQQQVVSAVAAKAAQPQNWGVVMRVLNENVETNLSAWDMLMMAPPVMLSSGQFDQLVINRDYILPGPGYSVPNYEALNPWISDRFD